MAFGVNMRKLTATPQLLACVCGGVLWFVYSRFKAVMADVLLLAAAGVYESGEGFYAQLPNPSWGLKAAWIGVLPDNKVIGNFSLNPGL